MKHIFTLIELPVMKICQYTTVPYLFFSPSFPLCAKERRQGAAVK